MSGAMSEKSEENPRTITGYLHAFGPYIKKEDIPKILSPQLSGAVGTVYESHKDLLQGFFELPIAALSPQILERYFEVTEERQTAILERC